MLVARTIAFHVNNAPREAAADDSTPLIYVLRNDLKLKGTRFGCGEGVCGCCTVLIDGQAVSGCLFLAVFADRADVVTVEHLAASGKLTPVQEAFLECGASQCGFCTPGFVLMASQLLAEHPNPDEDEIRHYLSGNLCRCGAYPEIIEAVKLAARRMRASAA